MIYIQGKKKIQLKAGSQVNTHSSCTLRAKEIPIAKTYSRFFFLNACNFLLLKQMCTACNGTMCIQEESGTFGAYKLKYSEIIVSLKLWNSEIVCVFFVLSG